MSISPEPMYTVLLVDDNQDLLQAMSFALEEIGGFRVVCANDGVEGLELFFEINPDCVVIDVKMPGLSGYQLVRAFRGDSSSLETPLIMLTALAQDKDQFAGLAVGADVYLVKPVKPQILAATIHQAIKESPHERTRRYQELVENENPPSTF
ncbi:MAG TPA: response regulator [Ktedonobacteraceae bacterium]|nr:response regulator [Ktedonobacteraceae bacterium]